jgi:biotin carboxylase
MKKLAIIGGGYMAKIYSQNAHEMEIETHAFSLKTGIVDENAFDYVYDVNILDKKAVLALCKQARIDGVVATTELTIATAAYVADKMGLIAIPYEIAKVITDKYRNRQVSSNVEGLNHPKFCEVSSCKEILDLNYNYPIVLKPTSKGGKRGVVVINSKDEVKDAFEYTLQDSGNALPFIVEEFITAEMECSVESLSYHGKNYIVQVTEKITSGPPHCVELAHFQPARLSPKMIQKIQEVLNRGLTAIGIENGPCHTEIRIRDDEIYLVEFNARPGGDHIAYPLTELSTGYPYIKGAIQVALGCFNGVNLDDKDRRYAGVLFVTEQTADWKALFDKCQDYDWCYKKNFISNELQSITHNNGFNLNYFIFCSDQLPEFISEI